MIKRILLFAICLLALFAVAFFIHSYFLSQALSYTLWHVYVFHVLSCLFTYTIVEIVSEKLPNQTGYSYLALMFFKIAAFILIFQVSVFSKESLSQLERMSLVIPLIIFLIFEVAAISRILNRK